jgi:predicted solute-binding protein
LDSLIVREAQRTGLPRSLCDRYLREVMTYRLDESCLQGLERFRAEILTVSSSPE